LSPGSTEKCNLILDLKKECTYFTSASSQEVVGERSPPSGTSTRPRLCNRDHSAVIMGQSNLGTCTCGNGDVMSQLVDRFMTEMRPHVETAS